jgi:hypothetical protein
VPLFGRRSLRGAALLWAGRQVIEHGRKRWNRLTPEEQSELQRLIKLSRGRPSNLSAAERDEVNRIVRKAMSGRDGLESTGPDRPPA